MPAMMEELLLTFILMLFSNQSLAMIGRNDTNIEKQPYGLKIETLPYESEKYRTKRYVHRKGYVTVPHIHGQIGRHGEKESFQCPKYFTCKCKPFKKEVNCGYKHLTKLPDGIPESTERLYLYENNFTVIPNDMFVNLSNLAYLNINWNNIMVIGKEAFSKLGKLETLSLGGNPTPMDVLQESVFCTVSNLPRLKTLSMETMLSPTVYHLKQDSFQCLQNSSVRIMELYKNFNMCGELPDDLFAGLRNVKEVYLGLSECTTFNMKAFRTSSISSMGLKFNLLGNFPSFIDPDSGSPIMRNIQYLDVANNNIRDLTMEDTAGLQTLQHLRFANNILYSLRPNILCNLTSLQFFDVTNNKIKVVGDSAFLSKSLQVLYLSRNPLTFEKDDVTIFRQATNLQVLYVGNIDYQSPDVLEQMYQNISFLRVLQISTTDASPMRIHMIPKDTFQGLRKLRTLNLCNNQIRNVHEASFRDLTSLRTLYLGSNELQNINKTSFPQSFMKTLQYLNISYNPWQCTCDLMWFKEWLTHTNITIDDLHSHPEAFKCNTPPEQKGKSLLDIDLSESTCLTKPLTKGCIMAFVMSLVICIFSTTFSASYRYRWHIKTNYFHFCLWLHNDVAENEDEDTEFGYDVFVSYDKVDVKWLKDTLIQELEVLAVPPFKLCIEERNWPAGGDIMDRLEQSVENSRKILLFLTNNYAKNPWCLEEMTFAQLNQLEKDKNNIILAVMEDIEPANVTPRLMLEMKRRPSLQWTDDPVGQKLFWKTLKHHLRTPNISVRREMPTRQIIEA